MKFGIYKENRSSRDGRERFSNMLGGGRAARVAASASAACRLPSASANSSTGSKVVGVGDLEIDKRGSAAETS